MVGCQYKYMDRYYVMVGETFQGIVPEPLFLETTEGGEHLSARPARLDGWYLGVKTGRRLPVRLPEPPAPKAPWSSVCLALVVGLAAALIVRTI